MKYIFILIFSFPLISCLNQGKKDITNKLDSSNKENCFEDCWKNFSKGDTIRYLTPAQLKMVMDNHIKIVQGLIGCKIPEFNVETIDGKTLNTSALKGRVIVLNFWFTSCEPCVAEIPALNKLKEEYSDSEVEFIAFAKNDSLSLHKFLMTHIFKYNIVPMDSITEKKFCLISGYPTNMVFDKDGLLQKIFSGGSTDKKAETEAYNKMKPEIDKYLKEY